MPSDLTGRVTLEASVSPSEDRQKVLEAVTNVIGEAHFTARGSGRRVVVECAVPEGLLKLHDQLRDRHVRGAARRRMLVGTKGNRTAVIVNRQAAAAGVLALCDDEGESPLGPIYMTIESDRLQDVVDWLTDYSSG